jgi:hypothetical protein
VWSPLNVPDNAPALIVGDVSVLFVRVFVEDTVGTTTPSTEITPAEDLAIVVSVACPNSILPTPSAVEVDAVIPLTGRPVAFVKVPDDGVPRAPLNNTTAPADPVLTASAVATPVPKPETPVEIGRPVQLVSVPEDGVPRAGDTRVGLFANTLDPVPVTALNEIKSASQSAAVVAAVPIHRTWAQVPGRTVTTKLPPEEFTVRLPVETFSISKLIPVTKVLVTGRTIV